MKCKECGAELKPDARFCPSCGARIDEAEQTVVKHGVVSYAEYRRSISEGETGGKEPDESDKPRDDVPKAVVNAPQAKPTSNSKALVIAAVAAIACVAIGAFIMMGVPNNTSEPVKQEQDAKKTKYVTVTFDGNGDDEKSVFGKEIPSGEEFLIPGCEFSRKGYFFAGWCGAPKIEDGTTYSVGDKRKFWDSKTLYAIWAKATPRAEHNIQKLGDEFKGAFDTFDASDQVCCVAVTNNSDLVVSVEAEFTFESADGKKTESWTDWSESIEQGTMSLLMGHNTADLDKASYVVKVKEPLSNELPLTKSAKLREASASSKELILEVENTSDNTLTIHSVRWESYNVNGDALMGDVSAFVILGPHETQAFSCRSNDFRNDLAYRFSSLADLASLDRTYYVAGFATKEDYTK